MSSENHLKQDKIDNCQFHPTLKLTFSGLVNPIQIIFLSFWWQGYTKFDKRIENFLSTTSFFTFLPIAGSLCECPMSCYNRLNLNVEKSKYMLLGGNKRVKEFGELALGIDGKAQKKLTTTTTVELSSAKIFHGRIMQIPSLQKNVAKNRCPKTDKAPTTKSSKRDNSLILPLFDYADIVCGDRCNKVLMHSLQVLQNKAAKVILNFPNKSSSLNAFATLSWKSLEEKRKLRRISFLMKNLLNTANTSNKRANDVHTYNTRNKERFRLPLSRTNWGKQRSYLF